MAFDESLAARIRDSLARRRNVEEKKMFGGVGLPAGHRTSLDLRTFAVFN